MILQALKEYYDRKAADPESQIAPPGFEWKEIHYVVVLQPDGIPMDLCSTFEGEGKKRRAKRHLVPKAVKRSVGIVSNLLWDNPAYVLGVDLKGRPERVSLQHAAFIERVAELGVIQDEGLEAVRCFLALTDKQDRLGTFGGLWDDLVKTGLNVSFRLCGEGVLVAERPAVQQAYRDLARPVGEAQRLCLVTGRHASMARLHPSVKGVYGAQPTGGNIVSFNLDAFCSHGKAQGGNAPVSEEAAFAYTTALNYLLGKDSTQRMQVGDASTIFWASKACDFEQQWGDFFGQPPKDDPDRNTRAVEALFKAVQTGAYQQNPDTTRFYVLGLAPNAGRLAVRFWISSTVGEMASLVQKHFVDTRIAHGPRDPDALSLFRLLVSTAVQGKAENIPPHLGGEVMRSILGGLPYPEMLLQATIRRVRAEREVSYPRAALIKACINRRTRYQDPTIQEELKMALDESNTNTGYRLGRLFATLEKIQQEANPGINATIRDRFYGAASGTPVTVFGNLMRLKNHHLAKLEHEGRRIFFERLLGQIMEGIGDFPAHLALADQGRFAIGYYHQMQGFYSRKGE